MSTGAPGPSFTPSPASTRLRYVLVWKDIIEQLEEALDSLDHITYTVEGIVLTYA